MIDPYLAALTSINEALAALAVVVEQVRRDFAMYSLKLQAQRIGDIALGKNTDTTFGD